MSRCLIKNPKSSWLEIMPYDEKSIVSRLVLWSTVYHIWFQRNASIHQGRLLSEEAMVRMIRWEVKNRVECNSYCNSVQNRRILSLGVFCVLYFRIVAVNGHCLL